MYSLTIFKNTYDNKTHRTMDFSTWEEFEDLLHKLSNKEGQKGGKHSSPLISPARYQEGSTRSNRSVSFWGGWAAVDVDTFTVDSGINLSTSIQSICGSYKFICYSTASSTPTDPKFRLVFPLDRKIGAKEIPHFWYALNKELGDLGDKQTKDLSRMYYVPAQYPEAFNFWFTNKGEVMNVNDMMDKWEFVAPKTGNTFLSKLPESLREEVIKYRKEQMQNTEVRWTSYRDCPFFPKKLAREYMSISETGWYHKMYQIMVATAGNAIKNEYPITPKEIADLCRELDNETGKWYDNRPLELEANSAIEYVYRN